MLCSVGPQARERDLPGFSAVEGPEIEARVAGAPCLLPVPERTSLVVVAGDAVLALTAGAPWTKAPLAALPAALDFPRLRVGPLAATGWRVAVLGGETPLVLGPAGGLQPLALPASGRMLAAATDLDRDALPEVWVVEKLRLPALVPIETGETAERVELYATARTLLQGSGLVPWDLDEDYYEDLIVLETERPFRVLRNEGDFELASADAGSPRLRLAALRLGPLRGDLQWAVGWDALGTASVLVRTARTLAWSLAPAATESLDGVRVHDARILDLDADGSDELVVLGRRSEDLQSRIELHDLPGTRLAPLVPTKKRAAAGHAFALLVGDLDGDGAPDLVAALAGAAPLVWRNDVYPRQPHACRVFVAGLEDRVHAVGAYAELWAQGERWLRMRWPPATAGDQLQLWLTWPRQIGIPELRVTYPDGNAISVEITPGGLVRAQR